MDSDQDKRELTHSAASVKLTVKLLPDEYRALKVYCAENRTTVQDTMRAAFREWARARYLLP